MVLPGIPEFDSLAQLLMWRAAKHPEQRLYTYTQDVDRELDVLTYAQADRRARAIAQAIAQVAQPGERALLLYPSSLEYPVAFLACLYANVVAVPAYPPDPGRPNQSLPRILHIVADAGARLILTTQECLSFAQMARSASHSPDEMQILATDQIPLELADQWQPSSTKIEDPLAFLQYTSGSTGTPKGVMISHRNLMAHQKLSHEVFCCREGETTVSWLPFYHDMGLIGPLLYPLYSGGHTVLMSPMSFLRRPLNWLYTISKYRASVSTGPNFAYEQCIDRAQPHDIAALDLSSWKLTVCGAEPLKAKTLRRFVAAFGPCGFRPETFLPCYGMAEATLMVTGTRRNDAPHIRRFDAKALRRGHAIESDDEQALEIVGCGWPMREHDLEIVDPTRQHALQEGEVGEIWLHGPSVGRGYWGQIERSRERFAAEIAGQDVASAQLGWFRTGDCGFKLRDELFVVGREHDRLRTSNQLQHHAHLLEQTVHDLQHENFAGIVAAFASIDDPDEICIAIEVKRREDVSAADDLCCKAAAEVRTRNEVSNAKILAITTRQIAKTSSGKLRRFAYAQALSCGSLEIVAQRQFCARSTTNERLAPETVELR